MSLSKHLLSACFFFFLLALHTFAKPSPTDPPQMKKLLTTDQVEIAYTLQGKGDTALIFIHGGFANRNVWVHQMNHFSKKHRVISIDLAGHGQSGKNRVKWDILSCAQDVQAIMEQEKIAHAILIGNSVGGPIIVETARLVPDKIVGLVPVDSFHEFNPPIPASVYHETAKAFRTDFIGTIKEIAPSIFYQDIDPTQIKEVEKIMLQCDGETAAQLMENLATYDEILAVKKISQPIRCINGDLSPTLLEKNRTIYPNFEAVILPHTGHYPMLERPNLFNHHLKGIIKNLLEK